MHGAKTRAMVGKRYGMLTVVEYIGKGYVWTLCDCGKRSRQAAPQIREGATISCGCFRASGGHARTHGLHKSKEYKAWRNMKARCYNPRNPKFHNYGARGIMVDPRWL